MPPHHTVLDAEEMELFQLGSSNDDALWAAQQKEYQVHIRGE